MSAKDADGKPKAPARPAGSSFDLDPVRTNTGSVPKPAPAPAAVPGAKPGTTMRPAIQKPGVTTKPPSAPPRKGASDFEITVPGGTKLPSLADMRRITSTSQPGLTPVTQKPPERKLETPFTNAQPGLVRPPSVYARSLQSSGFDDEERTQIDAVLGNVARLEFVEDEEEVTVTTPVYDGESAPVELTSTDTWKAVNAPLQSRAGRRSASVYRNLIDQFAVTNNRRYVPDAAGKTRMHVFIWDVTRAMSCEVPHFLGGREMTAGQTVDWVRFTGPTQGWRPANAGLAAAAADRGEAALALPKDPKVKMIAIVRPGGLDAEGFPRVAAACAQRGSDLSLSDALSTRLVEYFIHL